MCEPVSIISGIGLAISAGSEIANYSSQKSASDANAQAAQAAAARSLTMVNARQGQETDAATQTILQMDAQARRAEAMTRLSAGESGVAGTSVDLLLSDIDRQKSVADQRTKTNLSNTYAQLDEQRQGILAGEQSQINSVPEPNPFATALKIGGDALGAGSNYIKLSSLGASAPSPSKTQQAGDKAFDEA